ncbi:MAG: glycosyltransferase [Halobacteriovoraceae bacterium]|nr:glycosyltransferase [Halobacteriovoraceae bacterium]
MKIVFQHFGVLPVKKYGGIERILFWHMKELARRGHQVVLFAEKGSEVEQYGIEFHETPADMDEFERQIPADTDIVHLTYTYSLKRDFPTLINIQGNGQIGETFPLNTVFVSKKHAENHGSDCFIYNALDLEEYPYEDREYECKNLLFLAKGSWKVKNLKDCVWLAKKSKKKLHIAGGRTLIPSRFVKSYGFVGGEEKRQILKTTDALLFPVRWHEPFGIAIIEAMAHGSPVFGTPYGSLSELINKKVGGVFSNREDLLSFLKEENSFSRSEIRKYIEENFSIARLTDQYITLYEKIISGETLNKNAPTWQPKVPPLELLPF